MPAVLTGGFHEGEAAVRSMLKVPPGENPTSPGLHMGYAMRVMQSPLMALGTLDEQGRPWTTVWGGEAQFAQPIAQNVLGLNSAVDTEHDPVFKAFFADADEGSKVVQNGGGGGKMMSALSIDLMSRDRVKLAGGMAAAAQTGPGDVQMAMIVKESLGNCPKYLNKKRVLPHPMAPELAADTWPLPKEALDLVGKADMFFLSSTNGETMDTNHRGGAPGFVRVVRNEGGGLELVYPEYSGNRLYQTLGNLKVNPRVGIAIPDFDTADVLYLTGTTSILVGEEALAVMARTRLAVKITVEAVRFVKSGLPFRGAPVDHSPYNPPVRHLVAEDAAPAASPDQETGIAAKLIRREEISPTIRRFTFKLSSSSGPLPTWQAGQHISLNFEPELGAGYAHMRDDDPQSLNDDLVRTFTVSSAPGQLEPSELQVTARLNGPATTFLWRHNLRVPLELPVLGFGGEDRFQLPTTISTSASTAKPVFVAGGVGITPLLAQARAVLDAGVPLKLLWSLRGEDLALATLAFDEVPGLAAVTTLFVTGGGGDALDEVRRRHGQAAVETRRMGEGDVDGLKGEAGRRFYLCAGGGLLGMLRGWLDGEDVVWEDFGY